mmetsp:Transcript_1071/g.2872  ORF Transcript_1071/g.2872 Transcript_1071/m.2872 type:complete len:208 (-) Transcript_1071:628-1251(-)
MSSRYLPGTWKNNRRSLTSSSAPAMDSIFGVVTRTTRCLGRVSRRLDTSFDELPRPNPLDRSLPSSLCVIEYLGSHSPSGSFVSGEVSGRFTALSKLNALAFFAGSGASFPLGAPAGAPLGAILPPGVTFPSPCLSPFWLLSPLSLMAWTPGPVLGPTNVFFGRVYLSGHFRSCAVFTASIAVSTTMFRMRSSRWHSSKVWVETTKS